MIFDLKENYFFWSQPTEDDEKNTQVKKWKERNPCFNDKSGKNVE